MMRYNEATDKHEDNPLVEAFIDEIVEVCKKHNFSIDHEDGQGGFIITTFNILDSGKLRNASLDIGEL